MQASGDAHVHNIGHIWDCLSSRPFLEINDANTKAKVCFPGARRRFALQGRQFHNCLQYTGCCDEDGGSWNRQGMPSLPVVLRSQCYSRAVGHTFSCQLADSNVPVCWSAACGSCQGTPSYRIGMAHGLSALNGDILVMADWVHSGFF